VTSRFFFQNSNFENFITTTKGERLFLTLFIKRECRARNRVAGRSYSDQGASRLRELGNFENFIYQMGFNQRPKLLFWDFFCGFTLNLIKFSTFRTSRYKMDS
jgi:hypothetical protein